MQICWGVLEKASAVNFGPHPHPQGNSMARTCCCCHRSAVAEVERLIEAVKQNRSGHRDATAILVAYRHGLRASELVALRWDDIDLATGRSHVRRAPSGLITAAIDAGL
jgi:hypothetical protein